MYPRRYWYDQPTNIFDLNIFPIAIYMYAAYNLVPDFNHTESDKCLSIKEYDTASINVKWSYIISSISSSGPNMKHIWL